MPSLQFHQIVSQWQMATVAAVGVIIGTVSGKWMLRRIPENIFRMMVSAIIFVLGIWMLIHPSA